MTKSAPIRTCVACRKTIAKQLLLRLVAEPDGSVGIDRSGNKPGRGAYICFDMQCFAQARRKNRLARALRIDLDESSLDNLALRLERVIQVPGEPAMAHKEQY